jgi:hypothetical protein
MSGGNYFSVTVEAPEASMLTSLARMSPSTELAPDATTLRVCEESKPARVTWLAPLASTPESAGIVISADDREGVALLDRCVEGTADLDLVKVGEIFGHCDDLA